MARRTSTRSGTRPGKTVERTRPTGRPSALTDRLEETLLGYLADGLPVETTCHLVGINPATYYRWMQRGEDARERLDAEGSLPEDEDRYREFREAALEARARAVRKMVRTVFDSAEGGHLLSEEPIINPLTGDPLYDGNTGQVLMKRSYSAPNGNLALRFLERARPADWSLRAQVEVSGSGGGPVQVEHTVEQVASLTERLAQVLADRGQEADEDRAIGDVVDADVVEDGD